MCSPLPGAFSLLPPPALAAEVGLLFSSVVLELSAGRREDFPAVPAEIWGIEGASISEAA